MTNFSNINVIEDNSKITFNFLNGSMDIVKGEYGAYAICPGCGSGKTTAIKSLILQKWYEGVLYAAFTKDEVNNMYQYIIDNINYANPEPGTNVRLTADDIIVLHSDYSKEGTDRNTWLNKPQELANKRIILCTHAKLLDEPLGILFNANFNSTVASFMGPDMAALNGYNECSKLPRQWIVIDEITDAKPLAKIKKSVLFGMGTLSNSLRTIRTVNGRPSYETIQLPEYKMTRSINSYQQFSEFLSYVCKLSPEYKNVLRAERTELDKLRNEQLTQALFHNYFEYANLRPDMDTVNVRYSYSSLINPGMKSYILLLDGTSDITLRDSSKFQVLTYPNKYNSQINFFRFPFGLSRRLKSNLTEDMNRIVMDELNKQVDNLASIIKMNEKTLIFCWRNFKKKEDEIDDSVTEGTTPVITEKSIKIDSSFSIPKYIKSELEKKGFKEGLNFSIEYYGSGLDKATNQFRDYDSVVLLGKYQVPNSVIWEFNTMYGTDISEVEYYSNRVVQAICRLRIRKHNSQSINVYITDDWNENVLYQVSNYLRTGINNTVFNNTNHATETMMTELKKIGITPKKAEQIAKLSKYDPKIYQSIINGVSYELTISLNTIFQLIPMSRKKSNEYNSIKSSLSKLSINLIIDSSI